ncbi:uncharacterized protein SCHCODRAFT_02664657 [Schizophyllum commune H4-8]|uniref:F-box domain-containing protein n=1 Tax=Schizophyllum commune (strain H4-8 / FGSC 9210) TaxID=578458 RepID=D8PXG2_SCHCM|nr:uncharacterized protein SCHCODRAFT_02664657 [Schizophyllum commune H4-8]KAI5896903.1 hypothetical protein SCHCODRAFT_02664657 [Schizophyllum commune H4-8]
MLDLTLREENDELRNAHRSRFAPDPHETDVAVQRILELEETENQLELEIATLTARCELLRTQKELRAALLSPWRRLPAELWAQIFTDALPEYWANSRAGRRRLPFAEVCHAWREMAFGIPHIWDNIRIHSIHNTPCSYENAIRSEIERLPAQAAFNLSLDMHLTPGDLNEGQEADFGWSDTLWFYLCTQCHRWRDVHLIELPRRAYNSLRGHVFTSMRRLSLDPYTISDNTITAFANAPRLTSFWTLLYRPYKVELPDSWTLVDLQIECGSDEEEIYQDVVPTVSTVLSCRQTLRSLSLLATSTLPPDCLGLLRAELPVLEELALVEDAIDLAPHILAPSLQTLTLVGDITGPVDDHSSTFDIFCSFMDNCGGLKKLRALALLDVVVDNERLVDRLRRLPSLKFLEVGEYAMELYDNVSPPSELTSLLHRNDSADSISLLPNLSHLVIGFFQTPSRQRSSYRVLSVAFNATVLSRTKGRSGCSCATSTSTRPSFEVAFQTHRALERCPFSRSDLDDRDSTTNVSDHLVRVTVGGGLCTSMAARPSGGGMALGRSREIGAPGRTSSFIVLTFSVASEDNTPRRDGVGACHWSYTMQRGALFRKLPYAYDPSACCRPAAVGDANEFPPYSEHQCNTYPEGMRVAVWPRREPCTILADGGQFQQSKNAVSDLRPHPCVLHNYNEERVMEYRYFVITLPYGFKVHLRTAVSGTLSIIPGPNVVRTKEVAGFLEDRIQMDIHMGKEPQQPFPVQFKDPTDAALPHKLFGEGLNPSRLRKFVARDGLRAHDYAFPATYPADVDPMPEIRLIHNCFPAVPESHIPDARNVELMSAADYLGIYEKSLESRGKARDIGLWAIPGKILRRLLDLGYTTEEEYESRLTGWDHASLDHYDKLCQTRLRSGRQGYLPDGQHPWRIVEARPPQLLPSREEVVPRYEALTPEMTANFKRRLLYFFPPAVVAEGKDIQFLERELRAAWNRDDQAAANRLQALLKPLYDKKEKRMLEDAARTRREKQRQRQQQQQRQQWRQQQQQRLRQQRRQQQQQQQQQQMAQAVSGMGTGELALDEAQAASNAVGGDGEEPPTERVHLGDSQQDEMVVDTPGAGPSSGVQPPPATQASGAATGPAVLPPPPAPSTRPARRGRGLGLMRTETFENVFVANGTNERRHHMRTTHRWLASRSSPSPPPGPPPPAGPIIVDGPRLHVAGPEEMDMGGDTTDEEDDDAEVEQTEAQEAEAERTDTEGTDMEGSETETDMDED